MPASHTQNTDARFVFNTLAEMRAFPDTDFIQGIPAMLQGSAAAGDQVAKFFYWDTASTGTDDGNLIVKPTATTTGRWLRVGGSGAVAVDGEGGYINALDHSVTGDGSTDDTAAIQSLVDNAIITGKNRTIFFPAGVYKLTSAVTITDGVTILGEGQMSESTGTGEGTVFNVTHSGYGFIWAPTGTVYGSGGMIRCRIHSSYSGTGSDAILVKPASGLADSYDMIFRDIMVSGGSSSSWTRGMFLDTSLGGSGSIQNVMLDNVYLRKLTSTLEGFKATGVTNLKMSHVETSHNSGSLAGATFDNCAEVVFNGAKIDGFVTIAANTGGSTTSTPFMTLEGRIRSLDNNNADLKGYACVDATSYTNQSNTFKVMGPRVCSFMGKVTSAITAVTGDSTEYTVVPTSEVYDENSSFDVSTGVFTAKIAGRHEFGGAITFTTIAAGHNNGIVGIVHKNSGGTVLEERLNILDLAAIDSQSQLATINVGRVVLEMAEGDTAELRTEVNGSSKTVAVYGTGSNLTYTYFEGRYIG